MWFIQAELQKNSCEMLDFNFLVTDFDILFHHHHVQEGLSLIPVPCILKMKLVPPSLPRPSYVSLSFWFIL